MKKLKVPPSADLWPQVKAARYPRKDLRKVSKVPRVPSETSEQSRLIDWARKWAKLDGIDMLFSIPNAHVLGKPHYNRFALAQKLLNEGLKAGVVDLFLSVARHGHHGLYIEMKKKKGGRLSPDQESFIIRAQEEGYKTVVCEGADAAIKAISEYLRIER